MQKEVSGVVHEASREADLIAQCVRRRDHVISRLQCDWRALSYDITVVDLLGFLWVCDSKSVDLQASFMRHHRIEMNWRVKPIRSPKVLKGHDDHVITCLQFSGNRIVSGSDDNTLKVWSATTGKVRLSTFKHQIMKVDYVFCSKYSLDFLGKNNALSKSTLLLHFWLILLLTHSGYISI